VAQVRLFAVAATGLVAGYVWFGATNLVDSIASSAGASAYTFDTGAGMWLVHRRGAARSAQLCADAGLVPEGRPAPATAVDEEVSSIRSTGHAADGLRGAGQPAAHDTYQPPEKRQST